MEDQQRQEASQQRTFSTSVAPQTLDALRAFYGTEPHRYRVQLDSLVRTPLRTGRRGTRSRAEHARALHLARLKRRRERRHGIPAKTYRRQIVMPHTAMSGIQSAVAPLGESVRKSAVAVFQLVAKAMPPATWSPVGTWPIGAEETDHG